MKNAMIRELIGVWELRGEMEQGSLRRETFRECADTLKMLVENDISEAALDERSKHLAHCRELLSSARAIAARKGDGTAWERFDASIGELGISGVTARTYRVLPSDLEDTASGSVSNTGTTE